MAPAYELAGKQATADRVRLCASAFVGFSPTGELLRSQAGVPTAVVFRCGAAFCTECIGEKARRNRRRILKRLRELQDRGTRIGPIPRRIRDADRVQAAVRELVVRGVRLSRASARAEAESRDAYLDVAKLPRAAHRDLFARTSSTDAVLAFLALGFGTTAANDDEEAAVVERRPDRRRKERRPHPEGCYVEALPAALNASGDPVLVGVSSAPRRRTLASFRVGLPPARSAYGARFSTHTQPMRPIEIEDLGGALDRMEDTLARFTRSNAWKGHVDAAIIRIEFELSTPERRAAAARAHAAAGDAEKAADLRSRPHGTWWHVHAHIVWWGPRRWPAVASNRHDARKAAEHEAWRDLAPGDRKGKREPLGCACTRCAGVDDEDALLLVWRRALVETRRYSDDLANAEADERGLVRPMTRAEDNDVQRAEDELLSLIRRQSHPTRRTWARALDGSIVNEVKLGGAHVKTPARAHGDTKLGPFGAIAEVVKYCVKPVDFASMPLERIAEVITATHRRRLLRCSGLLFGVPIDEGDASEHSDVEGVDNDVDVGQVAVDAHGNRTHITAVVWRGDDEAQEIRYRELARVHAVHHAPDADTS